MAIIDPESIFVNFSGWAFLDHTGSLNLHCRCSGGWGLGFKFLREFFVLSRNLSLWSQLLEGPRWGQQLPSLGRPPRHCLLSLCANWNLNYFPWISTCFIPSSSPWPLSPPGAAGQAIHLLPFGFRLLLCFWHLVIFPSLFQVQLMHLKNIISAISRYLYQESWWMCCLGSWPCWNERLPPKNNFSIQNTKTK